VFGTSSDGKVRVDVTSPVVVNRAMHRGYSRAVQAGITLITEITRTGGWGRGWGRGGVVPVVALLINTS
jgi:hypothetical protein